MGSTLTLTALLETLRITLKYKFQHMSWKISVAHR